MRGRQAEAEAEAGRGQAPPPPLPARSSGKPASKVKRSDPDFGMIVNGRADDVQRRERKRTDWLREA